MKEKIELLRKASESFQKRHDLKDGMVVKFKKEIDKLNGAIGVFMYWLPNGFGGEASNPLSIENFLIADCVVMGLGPDGVPEPMLFDSRFLEPVIDQDDSQLQLEL